ncbi:MAG: proton-conducting transporter membrane subunit [Solirubrobacterales bacterium]
MIDSPTPFVIALLALPLLAAAGAFLAPTLRSADAVGRGSAVATGLLAVGLATAAIAHAPGTLAAERAYLLDPAGGVFLALIGIVGALSALTSRSFLNHASRGPASSRRARSGYWAAFNLFWAALLAVPLADNLGIAWLLVEATTAASAVLITFSGKPAALEAGWKYVVLTTLGLTVTLLGIVVVFAASGADTIGALDWSALADEVSRMSGDAGLVAFVLIVVGLAAKVGWAPVHSWLPDAHSEAPPPVSALLSAALLPAVLLIAWRTKLALGGALDEDSLRIPFLAFGLASLAVAVPFLWRPMPFKRLLAYSSLEHMGIIAIGIGFASPIAIAGVVVHVAGHGIAKSLGFYTAAPLLRQNPAAATEPAIGLATGSGSVALATGVSLFALAGLPPFPLFLSELMILLGGFEAGMPLAASATALLLALGFLGLAHALVEAMLGEPRTRRRSSRSARPLVVLTVASVALMLVLTVAGTVLLPGSGLVEALGGGPS